MECAFNTKDYRIIPMTEEVARNSTYFGISTSLAMAVDSGRIDKESVRKAIIAGISPEDLLSKGDAPAKKQEIPSVLPPPVVDPIVEQNKINTNFDKDPFVKSADFGAMKLVDLKAYAKEHGIALKSSDSKEDIVSTLVASTQE